MDTPKVITPPELETEPAGEANTTEPTTQPINDAVEPPQTEAVQPPTEPIPTPETPTPHLPVDEALPEITPEPAPQGADLNHEDAVGQEAQAEATKVETPTNTPESENIDSGSEAGMTMPASQTQQGTAQLEPPPTPASAPASPPESLPAQAPVIIPPPPQNIVGLVLTKARLIIQLRKQKKLIKIMGLFLNKKSITNDDVEKLLHVSDATATRYLSQLEKDGKITQTGKTGHAVTYTKR
jgi:hypothetical protein